MRKGIGQISLSIIVATCIAFILFIVIIIAIYINHTRQLSYRVSMEKLKTDFERNLLQSHLEIQEQTLDRISKEIHDHINLSLTLAKLNLTSVDWLDVEAVARSVKSTAILIGSAISNLSDLSKSMNPDVIKSVGLIQALKLEIERLTEFNHFEVSYEVSGHPVFLNAEQELILFRIIQESFNNIIKHAKASIVLVRLTYQPDYLGIEVKDNGVGFDMNQTGAKKKVTAGLRNMINRAKLFGGQVIVESQLQRGTKILVTVPYAQHEK